jgi:antitoxin (DNA-binding transcriptional repressor) of toxin-antitoxin stability system
LCRDTQGAVRHWRGTPHEKGITVIRVTIDEAKARLAELIEKLAAGEEVTIVRGERAVAKLVGQPNPTGRERRPGSAAGAILHMASDFDAPLEDFQEYME